MTGDLLNLAAITRNVVQEKLKNDTWYMWAIARVSLPVKIDACIEYALYHSLNHLTML